MIDLDAFGGHSRDAAGVHLARRVHRVIQHNHAHAPVPQSDRRLGNADVGFKPHEHRDPAPCLLDRPNDLRGPGEPEGRLDQGARLTEALGDRRRGRAIPLRILLGDHRGNVQARGHAGQPHNAIQRLACPGALVGRQLIAVEPMLGVDDDQHAVFVVHQGHETPSPPPNPMAPM